MKKKTIREKVEDIIAILIDDCRVVNFRASFDKERGVASFDYQQIHGDNVFNMAMTFVDIDTEGTENG